MAVGLTQDKLAKALGITFQQIQKYEKGANRIGAGRLQAIARILEMPVSYFFADGSGLLNSKLLEAQNAVAASRSASPAEALRMLKSFIGVADPEARRHLIGIAEAFGHKPTDPKSSNRPKARASKSVNRSVYRTD